MRSEWPVIIIILISTKKSDLFCRFTNSQHLTSTPPPVTAGPQHTSYKRIFSHFAQASIKKL